MLISNNKCKIDALKIIQNEILNWHFAHSKIEAMDSCANVDKEIEKVLSKFGAFNDHVWRTLTDLIEYVTNMQKEFNDSKLNAKICIL